MPIRSLKSFAFLQAFTVVKDNKMTQEPIKLIPAKKPIIPTAPKRIAIRVIINISYYFQK